MRRSDPSPVIAVTYWLARDLCMCVFCLGNNGEHINAVECQPFLVSTRLVIFAAEMPVLFTRGDRQSNNFALYLEKETSLLEQTKYYIGKGCVRARI